MSLKIMIGCSFLKSEIIEDFQNIPYNVIAPVPMTLNDFEVHFTFPSEQLDYTVIFTLVHAGKYRTEDQLKIQTIHKLNTTQNKKAVL